MTRGSNSQSSHTKRQGGAKKSGNSSGAHLSPMAMRKSTGMRSSSRHENSSSSPITCLLAILGTISCIIMAIGSTTLFESDVVKPLPFESSLMVGKIKFGGGSPTTTFFQTPSVKEEVFTTQSNGFRKVSSGSGSGSGSSSRGKMFVKASNPDEVSKLSSQENHDRHFVMMGNAQQTSTVDDEEYVSHVITMPGSLEEQIDGLNDMPTNFNTRSTVADMKHHDIRGDGPSLPSYNYYYYDSYSQSYHMHQEYATVADSFLSYLNSSMIETTLPHERYPVLSDKYQPSLCSDGYTYGYKDFSTLRNAVHEFSNAYQRSIERLDHHTAAWKEYEMIKFLHFSDEAESTAATEGRIHPPSPLPHLLLDFLDTTPDPFVICPFAKLHMTRNLRQMPIHINAENVMIECDSCVINVSGTHFSFGPNAKNVLVRGLTLMGATSTSLQFHYDGADASFEDCFWINNEGVGGQGSVADVNSTSYVHFYRCEISTMNRGLPNRAPVNPGGQPGFVSTLTLRNPS